MTTGRVLGDGLLATAIAAAWPSRATDDMLVVADDGYRPTPVDAVRTTPILAVHVEPGAVVLGPVERADRAGCTECALTRLRLAAEDPDAHRALRETDTGAPSTLLTPLAADVVAAVIADELTGAGLSDGAQIRIDLQSLSVSTHPVVPVGDCPRCSPAPVLSVHDTDAYLDPMYGVVRASRGRFDGALVRMAAYAVHRPGAEAVHALGRGDSADTARADVVRRVLLGLPEEPAVIEHGVVAPVSGPHLDPGLGGLDAATARDWLAGHDHSADTPLLVPADWPAHRLLGRGAEATLREGTFAVLAHDAAMLTWYARRPVPRICLEDGPPPRAEIAAAARSALPDRDIMVFDTTPDHDVPCVLAVAVQPDLDDPGPFIACSVAAHDEPDRAIREALTELVATAGELTERFTTDAVRASGLGDGSIVPRRRRDPSLLHALPAVARHWEFLLGRDTVAPEREPVVAERLPRRLGGHGIRIVTVDETLPEHRAGGYTRLRVLGVGAVPPLPAPGPWLDRLPRLDVALAGAPPAVIAHPFDA